MTQPVTIGTLGEDATIKAIQRVLAPQRLPEGWVGIGDDCAVTDLGVGRAVTTTDLLIEDVHFRRGTTSAWDLGWKAMAVNVSDIASMGALPRWATVSVSAPGDLPIDWLADFYAGALALCQRYDLAIVGGDTVGSPGPVMLAVTVVGAAEHPVLRSGAQPGDAVIVTGPIGSSAAGFWVLEHPAEAQGLDPAHVEAMLAAHRLPTPQVHEGRAIASLGRAAMMDNSDGLARSVLWLAGSNDLAIELDASVLPMTPATRAVAARAGVDPLQWALYGGEDYNLVVLVPEEAVAELVQAVPGAVRVGTCRSGAPGAALRLGDRTIPLEAGRTYQHFATE
ncbi:MAG TPA: thiamine-phosphate kinase [Stenomitos sp.]